jgi:hypothetical protein
MTVEQPRPDEYESKKLRLVLPSLLPPNEGAFDDSYFDYLNDPERFKVAMQFRIGNDNPELLTYFEDHLMTFNPNLATKWLCVYYAMFEKSAQKAGLPPLRVSERIVSTYQRLTLLTTDNGFETGKEEETMRRIQADWERRKERDKAFSPELVKFWNSVDGDIKRMNEEDEAYNMFSVGDILPVISLQTLLQNQQDEFTLIGRFETAFK